jgi:nitronate monooxygenase
MRNVKMHASDKTVQSMLGIELPIIQAPMAGVQGSELAIAVAECGALGSLPCAMLDAACLDQALGNISAATNKPVNINFFCHTLPQADETISRRWHELLAPYYEEHGIALDSQPNQSIRQPFSDEMAEVLESHQPSVVSFHFGLPEKTLLQRVRATGATVLCTATTVEEAQWLAQNDCDLIIAQGEEAGGHRGMFRTEDVATQRPTLDLVAQITRKITTPVIAAGGIATPAHVQQAIACGASAVQVGSAYLLCKEATTSTLHRKQLRQSSIETAITNVFTGRPARSVVNRLVRELGPICQHAPPFPMAANAVGPIRQEAESQHSADFSSLWCGKNFVDLNIEQASLLTKHLAEGLV